MSNPYHQAVLLNTCIENLITNPDGIYVDLTFGGGGHSKEILKKLSSTGKLFAFDQVEDAHTRCIKRRGRFGRFGRFFSSV
jgi:16S rRNA (cytosine1402-N4)-methyltransferase